jgi:hypothetical protein
MIAALVIIEMNKFASKRAHFESAHSILGFITYLFMLLQGVVGVAQYFVPQVFGGVNNAKKIYKYHRVSGYVLFTLMLVTVCAATRTEYNLNVLHIRTWAVVVSSILVLAGVLPRVKKQKLGL